MNTFKLAKSSWPKLSVLLGILVVAVFGAHQFLISQAASAPLSKVWDTAAEWSSGSLSNVTVANNTVTLSKVSNPAADLALNRPVLASSVLSKAYPASNAVDGSLTTRWASASGSAQWIYVDLGAVYNLNEVRLSWDTNFANAYQVQVSNNAFSWNMVYTTTKGTGGVNDLTGLTACGRYLRIYLTAGNSSSGYSLWEIAAYGTPLSSSYSTSGSLILNYDASTVANWSSLASKADLPTATAISFQARTSSNNATWSAWHSSFAKLAASRYIQIQATLSTTNPAATPTLTKLTLSYSVTTAAVSVTLTASPTSITSGQASTLTWSSANTTSCLASGAWSGSQSTSGSISTGNLSQTATFNLSCSGSGGTASAAATVTVTASPPAPIVYVVPTSIADDCSQDIETQFAIFLATVPDGSTIQFQPRGCYDQDNSLTIADRNNLVIDGNSSTFRSQAGPSNNSVWTVEGGSNISFQNMTIYGSNPTPAPEAGCYDASLEWQYGIDYQATQGGTVNNVSINDVYGDFIEAEYDHRVGAVASAPTRNILVKNSTFNGNGRMGVGLTDVDGFILQNTTMTGVCWDAVDVETDVNQEYGRNIQILNNTFTSLNLAVLSNYGMGYDPNVDNITLSGNTETNGPSTCESAVAIGQYPGEYRSNYTIANNHFYDGGYGMDIGGVDNLTINGNLFTFYNLGCNPGTGVNLSDSHTVLIENNTFSGGYTGVDTVDGLSTGVTLVNNTVD
jgi:hypothetical protein